MGIIHFEDLPLGRIREALQLDWSWAEKYDGSYIEFGLDDNGRYFSRRKGNFTYYSLDDWPLEGWTRSFRPAHMAGEALVSMLKDLGEINPGDFLQCEILYGSLPNTIVYDNSATIVVTGASRPDLKEALGRWCNRLRVNFPHHLLSSDDGLTIKMNPTLQYWVITPSNELESSFTRAKLKPIAEQTSSDFESLLASPACWGLTVEECLNIKLNRRHPSITPEDWARAKIDLKLARQQYRSECNDILRPFKRVALQALVFDYGTVPPGPHYSEGIVCKFSNGELFKIVNRQEFTKANLFTHRVKYWLVGGRRPVRSCFLSRTAHWSKERRLARLDVLLNRYLSKRHMLIGSFELGRWPDKPMMVGYDGELHERMLLLFADVRKRIEDGR